MEYVWSSRFRTSFMRSCPKINLKKIHENFKQILYLFLRRIWFLLGDGDFLGTGKPISLNSSDSQKNQRSQRFGQKLETYRTTYRWNICSGPIVVRGTGPLVGARHQWGADKRAREIDADLNEGTIPRFQGPRWELFPISSLRALKLVGPVSGRHQRWGPDKPFPLTIIKY